VTDHIALLLQLMDTQAQMMKKAQVESSAVLFEDRSFSFDFV